jgi:hypothetical protein
MRVSKPLKTPVVSDQFPTQIYKLSQSSLAELARNSVIQSGFEMEVKRHWLGQKWYLPGALGNEINKVSLRYFSSAQQSPTFIVTDQRSGRPAGLPTPDFNGGARYDTHVRNS